MTELSWQKLEYLDQSLGISMGATVRTRFKVTGIIQQTDTNIKVEMVPTSCDTTPKGRIEIETNDPEASRLFVIGAEYYVDFSKA